MTTFEYRKLQDIEGSRVTFPQIRRELIVDGAWEIRLIRLLPSTSRIAPVECELLQKALQAAKVSYEALSYVWQDTVVTGDVPQAPSYILLDGCRFPVTQNLQAALVRLRHASHERILWVDQICINQADIEERNQQVKRMALIYGYSTRTMLWLGEEASESFRGMLLLRGLARVAKDKNQDKALAAATQEFSDVSKWRALDLLLKRSWWQRTWVVQECALPRDLSVLCGYREISWGDLIRAVTFIGLLRREKVIPHCVGRVDTTAVFALHRSRVRIAARESELETPHKECDTLLDVLSRYRSRQATDARDKVYALLHLAQDFRDVSTSTPGEGLIAIDYARSIEDIYQDVVKFLLASSQSLDFLSHCRPRRNFIGLPSWVPDWSDTSEVPFPLAKPYLEDGNSTTVARIDGGRLSVRGLLFDRVKTLSDACDDADFSRLSPSQTLRRWKALALHTPSQSAGPNDTTQPLGYDEEAFMRTIISNSIRSKQLDETTLPSCRAAYNIWDARASDTASDSIPAASFPVPDVFETLDFVNAMRRASLGRRFFVSAKGAIGLVPRETEKDDLLVEFWGVRVPFVVKQCGDYDGVFVGECYIYNHIDRGQVDISNIENTEYKDIWLV